MDKAIIEMIGGSVCKQKTGPGLIPGDRQVLTHENKEVLWTIFVQIGHTWKNVRFESSNLKSSWLEMIAAKSGIAPSYTGEYINAVYVVNELVAMYGEADAFYRLFLKNGIPPGPPLTRLAHAKIYVVNEFITMQVMASGFKHFGGVNYHGYVKGSRYNLVKEVREYERDKVTGADK
jgi:hypothetical protein